MTIAKVFKSGNSQAVRLPKEFRIAATEVEISLRGDEIILTPRRRSLADAFHLLVSLPADFMEGGRRDSPPQQREEL